MYIGWGKCPLVWDGGTSGGGLWPEATVTFGAWYDRECVADPVEWGGIGAFGLKNLCGWDCPKMTD